MANWYRVLRNRPRVEQYVLEFSPGPYEQDTRMLLLSGSFLDVYQSPWIAALLKLDGSDDSMLLCKTPDSASALSRARNVKLACSLYKYETGNLFGLHVGFDVAPPAGCPFESFTSFERIGGLDHVEQQERIRSALGAMDRISFCLAEGGEAEIDEFGNMSASGIDVRYEAQVEVPSAFRAELLAAYDAHVEEHSRIPASRRDFRQSAQRLSVELPADEDPIFAESGDAAPETNPGTNLAETDLPEREWALDSTGRVLAGVLLLVLVVAIFYFL